MTGPVIPVEPLIAPRKLEAMLADGTDREVWPVAYPVCGLEPSGAHFGDADRPAQIVQVFGTGCLMQHTAVEYEDKVLLAAGRFDNVISKMECT